jgi:MFS transporter, ACS family, glucarate transporter
MSLQAGTTVSTERPTRVRYLVMAFAAVLAVITYIDRVSISFAAPFIREELHLSTIQMGWVFNAFSLGYALFEIPGGFLGDWIGPRKVLTRIVVWWSIFTAATGWVWSYSSLLVIRFLFGAGEAGCFPNITRSFSVWLPQRERPRAQAMIWLSTRWGAAFTPPLVALVMSLVGWRHAFEVFACLGVVWAAVFFFWYRDDPRKKSGVNEAERALLKDNAHLAAGHRNVPWSRLVRSRQAWMLCGQYFCHSWGWYFYLTWLPTYLREGRHMAFVSTAAMSALPLFMAGLGDPVSVLLSARLAKSVGLARARRWIAYTGFAGASTFLLVSTVIRDPMMGVLAIGAAAFLLELVMPIAWSTTMDVGAQYAGTVSGAMNMVGNIAGGFSPMITGYILAWTNNSWNVVFYVAAAVEFLGIACWAFLDPVTPFDARKEAAS